ncbi:hypothetical protein [Streptomyces shenzhenensis]|uniref:PARP-type domain-containing protein n=1 Tax=Streptomyces shenzhenensis TaxID=943815 RepID=A0A3M0IHB5_9ACTN|nr:hypothetical protein [Streptomyces shenzhenensis]RMB87782.1 hypothetical protein CTZ28_02185 [Streptomyces shenzhenensis]
MIVHMCRVCEETTTGLGAAVHLGHEEAASGPGWAYWAHPGCAELAPPGFASVAVACAHARAVYMQSRRQKSP